MTIIHKPIRERYLHGERFEHGKRKAEAIRCYAGEWDVFCYVNGEMQRKDKRTLGVERYCYQTAMRMAREFVQGDGADHDNNAPHTCPHCGEDGCGECDG